jgi:hypothetical protein
VIGATIAALAEADHTRDMDTATALEASAPIIIYRSVNRDGQTFALDPLSRMRLRETLGDAVHMHPRVFIAHETAADYARVRADLAAQLIPLLTGVSEIRLIEFGGVSFRDPATEAELQLSP